MLIHSDVGYRMLIRSEAGYRMLIRSEAGYRMVIRSEAGYRVVNSGGNYDSCFFVIILHCCTELFIIISSQYA